MERNFRRPRGVAHLRTIYAGGRALYLVGFTIVCFTVKEGQYPPPEKRWDQRALMRGGRGLKRPLTALFHPMFQPSA